MHRTQSVSTAQELYRAAAAMEDMATLARPHIRPKHEKQLALFLGYYFNLGFAVELYLKAFLRDVIGADPADYGHDLQKLMDDAEKHGFSFELQGMKKVVAVLHPSHKGLNFRYAEGAASYPYFEDLTAVHLVLEASYKGMSHLA
ncbi:MAG: hypothetical protein KIT02_04855 [Devosia sp.]|uniref:hypothetical protein n=1 Tax=Devosia sp. TaxID=1871048 RepID=UPI0024C66CF1|nr:hypothetical protein [Devosia sp.]UYO00549.1 MAG: hypothetical protein KIT02_04855 [Devosia sp.]